MGVNNFNRKQCVKALQKLGFVLLKNRKGNHDKFIPPENLKPCNPPFIMIPRHKNLHCQNAIIKELQAMGGEDLVKNFRETL